MKGLSIVSNALEKSSIIKRALVLVFSQYSVVLYTILVFSPMNQPEMKPVWSLFIIFGRQTFSLFATIEEKAIVYQIQ